MGRNKAVLDCIRPDDNSDKVESTGQMKRTRNDKYKVNITKAINTYLLYFLFSAPLKDIELYKVITIAMYYWVCNIAIDVICVKIIAHGGEENSYGEWTFLYFIVIRFLYLK